MATFFNTIPGQSTQQSVFYRNIFTTRDTIVNGAVSSMYVMNGSLSRDPGQGAYANGSVSLIRTGVVMGKITATGLYRPSIIGLLNASNNTAATTITLAPAVATEVQRLISLNGTQQTFYVIAPPTAAGTVATITLTASSAVTGPTGTSSYMLLTAAIGTAAWTGGYVAATDGSHLPATVLCDNDYGIDVVSAVTGSSVNQLMQNFIIKGDFISGMIVNLMADDYGVSTDASVTTYIETKLQTNGRAFTFSNVR